MYGIYFRKLKWWFSQAELFSIAFIVAGYINEPLAPKGIVTSVACFLIILIYIKFLFFSFSPLGWLQKIIYNNFDKIVNESEKLITNGIKSNTLKEGIENKLLLFIDAITWMKVLVQLTRSPILAIVLFLINLIYNSLKTILLFGLILKYSILTLTSNDEILLSSALSFFNSEATISYSPILKLFGIVVSCLYSFASIIFSITVSSHVQNFHEFVVHVYERVSERLVGQAADWLVFEK